MEGSENSDAILRDQTLNIEGSEIPIVLNTEGSENSDA